MDIKSYRDLFVWQRGIELVKEVYSITKQFPGSETYGLISQMRRSAVSIPANIAEGTKRTTRKEYSMFLRIAAGSAAELETHIVIAQNIYTQVNFVKSEQLIVEVQKMLSALIRKLNAPRN